MNGVGLSGGASLRWEREYYASGSSLPGDLVDDTNTAPTGWSSSGGYLVPSVGATPGLIVDVPSVCTTQASASGYPMKPPISFVRLVTFAARWPSGGNNGKSSSLWAAIGAPSATHYGNGLSYVSSGGTGIHFVIEHTYGASGGTWSPNYAGLAEDTDINITLVSIDNIEFHALINGTIVASRENVYSIGMNFRPLNDNQLQRDFGGMWGFGAEVGSGIGSNKECRVRKVASWISKPQLPGI